MNRKEGTLAPTIRKPIGNRNRCVDLYPGGYFCYHPGLNIRCSKNKRKNGFDWAGGWVQASPVVDSSGIPFDDGNGSRGCFLDLVMEW
jgi:hypothetical protein